MSVHQHRLFSWPVTFVIFVLFALLTKVNGAVAFLLSWLFFGAFIVGEMARMIKKDSLLPRNPFKMDIPGEREMAEAFQRIRPFFASILGFLVTVALSGNARFGVAE